MNKQIEISETTLSLGIQDRLNISKSRRDHIIGYIKIASKGPEDLCNVFREIPLNFKGNERYYAIYIVSLFVIHHSDSLKKRKDDFLDDMWQFAAKCFDFDLENLLNILSELLKKDTLTELINRPFENEKIVLLFLYYTSMLGSLRR